MCHRRGVKHGTGVDRWRCRSARARRNHVGLAIRALLRLEVRGFRLGVSRVAARASIVRAHLTNPWLTLPPPASA